MTFPSALWTNVIQGVLLAIYSAIGFAGTDTMERDQPPPFHGDIVLTRDPAQLVEAWQSLNSVPQIKVVEQLHLGDTVSIFVLLTSCTPNASTHCNVTSTFSLVEPSGARHKMGTGPLIQAPPKVGSLMLGTSSVDVSFDASDMPGVYTIEADIIDHNSDVQLHLKRNIQVNGSQDEAKND